MNIRCLKVLLMLVALLGCGGAWAQECLLEASGINFGEYNPLDNQAQDATGIIRVACNNPTTTDLNVLVCLGLREGSAGISVDNRQMVAAPGAPLKYQLSRNPTHTARWGLRSSGEYTKDIVMIHAGTMDMTVVADLTLYGRILSGQEGAIPGSYASHYTFPDQFEFVYTTAPWPGITDCEGVPDNQTADAQNFSVTATVPDKCEIKGPEPLDFGTWPGLEISGITSKFGMEVRCTRTTSYTIALDDGMFSSAPGQRRMQGDMPGWFIDYEIYQDSAMSTRWGSTVGGVTGEIMVPVEPGDAAFHAFIGYGVVPAQTAPGVGTYRDRVTVTVAW